MIFIYNIILNIKYFTVHVKFIFHLNATFYLYLSVRLALIIIRRKMRQSLKLDRKRINIYTK